MSTRVLVLGLDSYDHNIARAMAAEGQLPHLAKVFERGAAADLEVPYGLFVGSVWRSFDVARRGHRVGRHCWDLIDRDTYEHYIVDISQERGRPFWRDLSDAGLRVAILDVPHARPETLNGVIVAEWGCHDHHVGLSSSPPEEATALVDKHGLHPILGFDPYAQREFAPDDYVHREGAVRTPAEELAMVSGLLDGAASKQAWVTECLRREDWDLFVAVFGEAHAVGHQQWHLHDVAHPRHDPEVVDAIGGDPLRRVYRALDDAVGAVLAEVDDDTRVIVVMSHGMGPHYDGTHLIEEVLRRIDITDAGGPLGGFAAGFAKRALLRTGIAQRRWLSRAIAAVVRRSVRRRTMTPCPYEMEPEARAIRRFFWEPNNSVFGGVRLNLVGRERCGLVAARDFDRVCDQLVRDLRALVNVDTGRPLVRAVHRTDEYYDREPVDSLPDLFVDWDRHGPIETVWSPKTGVVHSPYTHWRTGDHLPAGLLTVLGPTMAPGDRHPPVVMEDLGPSIAAQFGVTLSDADGQPIDWLAAPLPGW